MLTILRCANRIIAKDRKLPWRRLCHTQNEINEQNKPKEIVRVRFAPSPTG